MQTNQLYKYRESGFVKPVLGDKAKGAGQEKTISINRKEYNSGLSFSVSQALAGTEQGFAYFWLDKRYDKVSFIVGPRDNQSSNSSAWLVVKADKKTVYEGMVTQKDLAKQIVVDVKGASRLGLILNTETATSWAASHTEWWISRPIRRVRAFRQQALSILTGTESPSFLTYALSCPPSSRIPCVE